MQNAVQKVAGAAGAGFVQGIAKSLVLIILVALAVFIFSFIFGAVFLALAMRARRDRRPKAFLGFGLLSALMLSVFGGFAAGSASGSAQMGLFALAPVLFFSGIGYVISNYRKIKAIR